MKNKLTAIAFTAATTFTTPALLFSSLLITQNVLADSVKINKDGGLLLSITANRRAQAIDKTLASVTVITRKDIENTQTHDLVDLLRQQHGISIARAGGKGSQTSLFIRGSESDHVMIVIDGVKITSSSSFSSFDLSQIDLNQIERIEIVRGPRSALYGSDAIGGVIEITTRKNTRPYVSITGGRYGTNKVTAGFSDGDDASHVALNVSKEEVDGFSASNSKNFNFESDNDKYKKGSVSLSFSHKPTNKVKAGVDILQTDIFAEFDSSFTPKSSYDSDLNLIKAYVNSDFSDRWSQKIKLSHTKNNLVYSSGYTTTTRQKELDIQNTFKITPSVNAILGATYRKETESSFAKTTTNKALYTNLNHKRGKLNLDFSVRYDDHSKVGDTVTGQVAAGLDVSPSTTLYVNYGTAFKTPNLTELYSAFGGNPSLEPEESKAFEVGLKSRISKNHRFESSLFHTEVDNLISSNGTMLVNVKKATMKGLELAYYGDYNKFDWRSSVTLLRTKDASTRERLLKRPNHKLNLQIGYKPTDKTRLGMDVSFVGSRDDIGGEKMDKYTLLNLSLNQKLSKHTSLGLKVENVTNEDYELTYGYNTPKRSAYLTFSYK